MKSTNCWDLARYESMLRQVKYGIVIRMLCIYPKTCLNLEIVSLDLVGEKTFQNQLCKSFPKE